MSASGSTIDEPFLSGFASPRVGYLQVDPMVNGRCRAPFGVGPETMRFREITRPCGRRKSRFCGISVCGGQNALHGDAGQALDRLSTPSRKNSCRGGRCSHQESDTVPPRFSMKTVYLVGSAQALQRSAFASYGRQQQRAGTDGGRRKIEVRCTG